MKRIILLILFTLSFMIVNAQDMVQRNGRWVCPKHTNTTMELGTRCHVCRHEEAQANAKKEKENRARAEAERERKREEEAKNHKVVEVTSPERTLKIVWPDNEYKNVNKKETTKEEQNDKKEEQSNKSANENKSELTSTQQASVTSAVNGTMAEASGDYTSALNHYRSARNMGNYNVTESKIRQMEFMSGVQQIGGVINYWAENAKRRREAKKYTLERIEQNKIEIKKQKEEERQYHEKYLATMKETNIPIESWENYITMKETLENGYIPFIGSGLENNKTLVDEFENLRESLTYFFLNSYDSRSKISTTLSGPINVIQVKNDKGKTDMESYIMQFTEGKRVKGTGRFYFITQTYFHAKAKPPYSAQLGKNINVHQYISGNRDANTSVKIESNMKVSEIRNYLSETKTQQLDFGDRSFTGKYTIAIHPETKKFMIIFSDFNTIKLTYEVIWKGKNFSTHKRKLTGDNFLYFIADLESRKLNIDLNYETNQVGFFANPNMESTANKIGISYVPSAYGYYSLYNGEIYPDYKINLELKKTNLKSTGFAYGDLNETIYPGSTYMTNPWYFWKKN